MNNKIRTWSQEYPLEHWPEDYINVKDKIILDLGCGLFGLIDAAPHYQLNTCTTNYWMTHAAKKVIGLDMSETDIAWLRDNVIFTEEDENGNLVPRAGTPLKGQSIKLIFAYKNK